MDFDLQDAINAFNEDEEVDWGKNMVINSISDTEGLTNKHICVLRENFGHDSFRPMQWNIIRTALEEKRDQCVVMATGYGKSLCFQYPSVYTGGVTLVISPLISLMEDQVMSLEIAGIPACFLGSAQSKKCIIEEIFNNDYRLVYLTPEFCTGDYGLDILQKMNNELNITLIAIDEAHCVSQWGHDFRHSYRNLGKLRYILKDVPILAVTATATEDVLKDISRVLSLKDPKKTCSGFDRPNLYFEVCSKDNKNIYTNLLPYLQEVDEGSVIIYTLTKKETENISEILKLQGLRCEQYHAGLPLKIRKKVHEDFSNDEVKIIVATIAFGMGIDKPDVRLVIHYGASKDMESYYQEVGRAGRDGLPSKCVTFFSTADFLTHDILRQQSYTSQKIAKRHEEMASFMKKYLYTTNCRRDLILLYFENSKKSSSKQVKPENCCDNCKKRKTKGFCNDQYEELDEHGLFDFTPFIKLMLETIIVMDGKFGFNMYISFLKGSCIAKMKMSLRQHPLFGAGNKQSTEWWKAIARIVEDRGFTQKNKLANICGYTIGLTAKGRNFVQDVKSSKNICVKIEPPADILKYLKKKIIHPREISKIKTQTTVKSQLPNSAISLYDENDPQDVKDFNRKLYVQLRGFRNQLSHEIDCSPYMIASDVAIIEIVRALPKTIDEFSSCHFNTFNYVKIQKFGKRFVEFIKEFTTVNNPPNSLKRTLPKDVNDKKSVQIKESLSNFVFKQKEVTVKKSAIFDVSSDEEDELVAKPNIVQTLRNNQQSNNTSNEKNNKNQDNKFNMSLSDDCDDDIEMAAALDSIENQKESDKNNEDYLEDLCCDSPPRIENLKRNIVSENDGPSTSNKISRY